MPEAAVGRKSRRKKRGIPQRRRPDHLRIAVKLNRRSGELPQRLDGWQRLLEHPPRRLPGLELVPLFESQSPAELLELVDRARINDPDYVPADFAAWFQALVPVGLNAEELAKALRKLDTVETAYVMRPVPPPVNPVDDDRNTNQGYEDAAKNGIDARYAWGFAGGDGASIGFVDLEQGWNCRHDDLQAAGITKISGQNQAFREHGTAVLGIVLMVDNGIGGVGIAPSARGRVVSQHRPSGSYNTADAILDAAANMAFGDVLLLEAQEIDPAGGTNWWPVEVADASFDAVRLATALGMCVVEADGNGGHDLDSYNNGSGLRVFDRSSTHFRDSGAILVGAGSSAFPHARIVSSIPGESSNYGNRVDCYAWGENIDTTWTNAAGTDNTAYTITFGLTSGASAIVAGAALVVQGIAAASLGYRFSPRALRGILTTNGTESASPNDRIGVMPDLRAIVSSGQINVAPDIYLRDYVGDQGNPTTGLVSLSPDIIVRQTDVANPQATYGAGSGTENDPSLSEIVVGGQDHFVFVRLLNRGGSPATNVSVDVYWSQPATLLVPDLWTLIGTVNLPSVQRSNVLTVSNALRWPAAQIPGPGHYCFIAVAGNAQDPKPGPVVFESFPQYIAYVRNNNNVAWRNFNVISGPPTENAPPGWFALDFIIPGAFDTGRRFELETVGGLPEGGKAFLVAPAWLAESLKPLPTKIEYDQGREAVRIPLHPFGVQRLGSAVLHARSMAKCRLWVHIPAKQRQYDYEFAVRQLYEKLEVGRVTWRFAARVKGGTGVPKVDVV